MIENTEFRRMSANVRELIIDVANKCKQSTHLGGALSMVDFLVVLYSKYINITPENIHTSNRDFFILSKGHCFLGQLAVMTEFNLLDKKKLYSFQSDGGELIAHPVKNLSLGIDSSNGSLGQGLSFAAGLSIGLRKLGEKERKVFVVLGDGECNEGSIWEAAASIAEFRLSNVIVIVDVNAFRNDGPETTYGFKKLCNIWHAFGWNTHAIDGHDFLQIDLALNKAVIQNNGPSVILCQTIKGKGIDFMEANNDWHHNRVTDRILEQTKEDRLTNERHK